MKRSTKSKQFLKCYYSMLRIERVTKIWVIGRLYLIFEMLCLLYSELAVISINI